MKLLTWPWVIYSCRSDVILFSCRNSHIAVIFQLVPDMLSLTLCCTQLSRFLVHSSQSSIEVFYIHLLYLNFAANCKISKTMWKWNQNERVAQTARPQLEAVVKALRPHRLQQQHLLLGCQSIPHAYTQTYRHTYTNLCISICISPAFSLREFLGVCFDFLSAGATGYLSCFRLCFAFVFSFVVYSCFSHAGMCVGASSSASYSMLFSVSTTYCFPWRMRNIGLSNFACLKLRCFLFA